MERRSLDLGVGFWLGAEGGAPVGGLGVLGGAGAGAGVGARVGAGPGVKG